MVTHRPPKLTDLPKLEPETMGTTLSNPGWVCSVCHVWTVMDGHCRRLHEQGLFSMISSAKIESKSLACDHSHLCSQADIGNVRRCRLHAIKHQTEQHFRDVVSTRRF